LLGEGLLTESLGDRPPGFRLYGLTTIREIPLSERGRLMICGGRAYRQTRSDTLRCIVLAGVDGSGKTTQAMELLSHLRARGQRCIYVWLRFPHLFSLPLLAYARLVGLTRYAEVDGHRHGVWEFYRSRFMSAVFPWVVLLDATICTAMRVYFPLLLGFTVICDRFVYDILVDLMVALRRDDGYHSTRVGRLFLSLLPRGTKAILLDLDVDCIRERRDDLKGDSTLRLRRRIYLRLAKDRGIPVVTSLGSVEETRREILELIGALG